MGDLSDFCTPHDWERSKLYGEVLDWRRKIRHETVPVKTMTYGDVAIINKIIEHPDRVKREELDRFIEMHKESAK